VGCASGGSNPNIEYLNPKQIPISNVPNWKPLVPFWILVIRYCLEFRY
jgi:hypothetical protein